MHFKRAIIISLAAVFIAGCATGPRQAAPLPQNIGTADFVVTHAASLDSVSNIQKHLNDDKDIVYHQEFGGGGAGLGILLGPIGAAANMSLIDANTQKDVDSLLNKIAVKPHDLFLEAAKGQRIDGSGDMAKGKLLLTPYVYVLKVEGGKLLVAAAILIERGAAEGKWSGKYMYQLPDSYSIGDFSHLDQAATDSLRNGLLAGYVKLLATVAKENRERVAGEKAITFKSNFLSPRADLTMSGHIVASDDDVTWVRSLSGVYALRKSSFYQVQ